MNEMYLTLVAERVLCKDGQFSVGSLIARGRIEEARRDVVDGVDGAYWDWHISFAEAAEYYNLLDLTPERARRFPQRHTQAFF